MTYSFFEAIANPVWKANYVPFAHIHARNIFSPSFYSSLCRAYLNYVSSINLKLRERENKDNPLSNNSIHIYKVTHASPPPLDFFLSLEWYQKLVSLFDIKFTRDINIAVHYHDKGSKNGWIHNDLTPGWFIDAGKGEINLADSSKCDYKTGQVRIEGIKSKQSVRSLAVIYYLNNPHPSIMVGGGTGLYKTVDQPVEEPTVIIPPENNSILIFPCTPYSFHTFLSNQSHQRCSIIMWLHSTPEYIKMKYGEDKIVNWK